MTPLPPQPLSPLDGRYRAAVGDLGEHLSEAGLNRARVQVEVEWLIALTDRSLFGSSPLRPTQTGARCARSYRRLRPGRDRLARRDGGDHPPRREGRRVPRARPPRRRSGLDAIAELTHFACTSEDINNLSYALTVQRAVARGVAAEAPRRHRRARATSPSSTATPRCSSRTHGQPATPTTMGKELAVFVVAPRARRRADRGDRVPRQVLAARPARSSAHLAADPDVDWPALSREFVESLGLDLEPAHHPDRVARLAGRALRPRRARQPASCTTSRTDVWTYISLGYFRRSRRPGATGLVDDAAQDQPDPLRERRGEPRALERPARLARRDARHHPPAARPHRLDDAAQHRRRASATRCSRSTTSQRGLGEIVARPRRCCSPTSTRNWEVLGEAIQTVIRAEVAAGRSHDRRPLRAAQGADPRQARRRGRARRVRRAASTSATTRSSACSRSRPRPTRASPRSSSTDSRAR